MILAIDPGQHKSGVVFYDGVNVYAPRVIDNRKILAPDFLPHEMHSAIEMVASYGMSVGESTFETVLWIGRFIQHFGEENVTLVYRKDVKMHLCNSMRAKDTNVRQAIIDKFEPTGGGKRPQFGTKKQPGPLYGVTSHAMSALAVAVTYYETIL